MSNALIEQIHAAKAEIEAAARAKEEEQEENRFVGYWMQAESFLERLEKDLGVNWRQAAIVSDHAGHPALKVRLGDVSVVFIYYTKNGERFWEMFSPERPTGHETFCIGGMDVRERLLITIGRVAGLEGGAE